jgi:excisionase family DNA binding protein
MQEDSTNILEALPSGDDGNGNGESTARSPEVPLGTHSNFTIRGQPSFEPILDSEEAATLLKIHPKTLQKLARNGKIPGFRIGKLWGFRASALNRWLESNAST